MNRVPLAFIAFCVVFAACISGPPRVATEPAAPQPQPAATETPATVTTTLVATTNAAAETRFPVTVTADNGDVSIARRPERVISLSATATEILFAVGAGEQVLAVDSVSNYPHEAPFTDLSAFTPNVEAIAGLDPDLVVISFDPDGLAETLNGLGIPVILQGTPPTLSGAYAQIEVLGAATGNLGEAALVIAEMQVVIAGIVENVAASDVQLTYFHELGAELYSVTSTTFIGEIYGLFGLENIADGEDSDGWGYPQLTIEYILDSDPDLIFLADTKCCGQTAATVRERPGWGALKAVSSGGVIEMDDDIASRWGPRIVEYVRFVAEAITAIQTVDA
jgi:iron complex transport system substrate-binding protein